MTNPESRIDTPKYIRNVDDLNLRLSAIELLKEIGSNVLLHEDDRQAVDTYFKGLITKLKNNSEI